MGIFSAAPFPKEMTDLYYFTGLENVGGLAIW